MFKILKTLLGVLDRRDVRQAGGVLLLVLAMAIVEAVGIASILPFLAVLANPDVVDTNPYLAAGYRALGSRSKPDYLFVLGAATFVLLVGSSVIRALTVWTQLRFTNLQAHAIGLRLIARYLNQPYHWFLNRHSSDLSVAVIHEVNNVVQNVLSPAMLLIANVASVIFILTLLMIVDPRLATAAVAVLGLVYSAVFMFARRHLAIIGEERVKANQERYRALHEALGGIKYVKLAGLESRFVERFGTPSFRMARLSVSGAVVGELPSLVMQALVFGGMLLVLLYLISVHQGVEQALPIVGLFAVAGYRLMPALQVIYKSLSQIRFALPSLDVLRRDLVHLESAGPAEAPHVGQASASKLPMRKSLKLQNVSYTYPNAPRPALRGLNIRVDALTTVGVVGTTGAGKTTFVDVILGLLAPTEGELRVDDCIVDQQNVRRWQTGVGYVPQNIFLLDDTIACNIAFGAYPDEVDMVAVERAARVAHLHDFVIHELPAGYETVVGEQGVRLSGGQRQRIGIARALYRDPDFIVFDEATSALDNLTELVVMEAMHELDRQKTMMIVAHRLSTVRDCDRILVLDGGNVVADGTYAQLVQDSEHFRSMVASGQ